MKDDFRSLEIEPDNDCLDFIGPAKLPSTGSNSSTSAQVLRGNVRFTLTKTTKIRGMSVKFKGLSNVTTKEPHYLDVTCPLLPKLKVPLFGRTSLPAGDHIIPWELDIPNIYPRSLLIKRASISYKVIVSISIGITKTITSEYPIVLKRHLLPYKELSPIIETKLYQRTIPVRFHYEIDAPQIVCIEQGYIPLAIKYVSIANQKPLQSIRTRIIQTELYRRQSPSKLDSNLTASNRDSLIFNLDKRIAQSDAYKDTHIKYVKRTMPALIHTPNENSSAWKKPCLVKHPLHPYLSYTLDSPLASIYHHIEIAFQFGMKYEEIKTKIPIIVASVPHTDNKIANSNISMMKYAFEEVSGSGFLKSFAEPKSSQTSRSGDANSSHSRHNGEQTSVIHDASIMPLASDFDEEDSELDNDDFHNTKYQVRTPIAFVSKGLSPIPPPLPNKNRRALSPTFDKEPTTLRSNDDIHHIKKFASALDLSTTTASEEPPVFTPTEEERPRTTTPTMKRNNMQRRQLQPINVDLANGKLEPRSVFTMKPPPTEPPPPPPSASQDSSSSDVLPIVDRLQQQQQTRQNNPRYGQTFHNASLSAMPENQSNDDLRSIYSDTSLSSSNGQNAPSLSSSATLSSNKSYPILHSRPPSPFFSPAPGLPATTALRPQDEITQAVEETFLPDSASIMSPAMNTVASSTLFSPRTTYSLQRRIALSTISSLTNDSLQFGTSVTASSRGTGRTFSNVMDSEIASLGGYNSSGIHSTTSSRSFDYPPQAPLNHRYVYAQLPPIPSMPPAVVASNTVADTDLVNIKAGRRQTRIYLDDSDEENEDDLIVGDRSVSPSLPPLPQIAALSISDIRHGESSASIAGRGDCAPRLPRLSFGNDLSISFGL